MSKQITLSKEISCKGVGLHSGKEVEIVFSPGDVNTGIVFVRSDLENKPEIRAIAENVTSTVRATTLSENDAEVFTVEHLLAALSMLGIDNCRISMSSPEPPVAGGSAIEFCDILLKAGCIEHAEEKKVYSVDKAFSVYDGDKYIVVLLYDGFSVSFKLINDNTMLGTQFFDIVLTE